MSSADDHRVSNGKGSAYQSALNMLAMLLPGAVLSYYGEEIAMLEMAVDDSVIAKYSSSLGRAVCCCFLHSQLMSILPYETLLLFAIITRAQL